MRSRLWSLLLVPLLLGAGQPIDPRTLAWDSSGGPDIVAGYEVVQGWDGAEIGSTVTGLSVPLPARTGTAYAARVRALPVGPGTEPSNWATLAATWPDVLPQITSLSQLGRTTAPLPSGVQVMAIAFVNANASNNTAAATTIASGALATTTGNAIFVAISAYSSNGTVTGVADTAGNTYVRAGNEEGGDATHKASVWYALNITGNASNVVTATYTGSSAYRCIAVAQFSGIATSGAYDQTAAVTTTAQGTTFTSNNTGTTTQADELVIASYIAWDVAKSLTATSPTVIAAQVTGGNNAIAYKIVSSTGAQSTTLTSTENSQYVIQVRTFKADTGGSAGSVVPVLMRQYAARRK